MRYTSRDLRRIRPRASEVRVRIWVSSTRSRILNGSASTRSNSCRSMNFTWMISWAQKGLTNYWGYNSIGFFTPESSYSTRRTAGCQVTEFKTLVRELHKAGMKVILDVVYHHTGEGKEMGAVLYFRGLGDISY